jgi:cytochrome c oxidase assembly factor CtaG
MVVAAPLIVLSRAMPALLWGLPKQMRIALGALSHKAVGVLWRKLTQPGIATLLHGVAIWAWHVPKLFQAALEQGLSLRPLGNTVYFMPPYIIDQEESDLLVQGTLRALDRCATQIRGQ